MYRLDIITKAGILVFSHDFLEDWLEGEEDHDLFAGLKSAAITALRETQGETITEIKQIDYTLILYEGILTYGMLTVKETDPKLHYFLRSLVLKFELMFTLELHTTFVFKKEDFEKFRTNVNTLHKDFTIADFRGLNKILDVVSQSNASNFIIYRTSTFQPLYTSLIDHSNTLPLQKIAQIFRDLDDLCLSQKKDTMKVEINLEDILFHSIRTKTHWIVCVSDSNRSNKYTLKYEVSLLKNILSDVPILAV
jgi:hypothetical protein